MSDTQERFEIGLIQTCAEKIKAKNIRLERDMALSMLTSFEIICELLVKYLQERKIDHETQ